MFPLPFDKFTITTEKSNKDIETALQNGTKEKYFPFYAEFLYEYNQIYIVPRKDSYISNSFQPRIKVTIKENADLKEVEFEVKLHIAVCTFSAIAIFLNLITLLFGMFLGTSGNTELIVSILLIAVFLLLPNGIFWSKEKNIKEIFTTYLR